LENLDELINKWIDSALEFREAERLINLLIVDNRRLEKANELCQQAADYLDTNKETVIGSGSVFHRHFRNLSR